MHLSKLLIQSSSRTTDLRTQTSVGSVCRRSGYPASGACPVLQNLIPSAQRRLQDLYVIYIGQMFLWQGVRPSEIHLDLPDGLVLLGVEESSFLIANEEMDPYDTLLHSYWGANADR